MKRIQCISLLIMPVLLLSACVSTGYGQTGTTNQPNPSSVAEQAEQAMENYASEPTQQGKILIAYFSWAENAVQDNIDAMTSPSASAPGNVAQLASWIASETGGDLFSIQVADPYPADWDSCLNRANQEKADGTHPALSEKLNNIDEYDTVFLGYPNWWYSCPMAIYSFLDEHDLSGKQIYLFCSHGTGGLASSVKDITAALPQADISGNVFHVSQDDTASVQKDIRTWLKELGFFMD